MFRRQNIGAGNQERAAGGVAVVASARLVVGKVTKGNLSASLTSFMFHGWTHLEPANENVIQAPSSGGNSKANIPSGSACSPLAS